MDSEDEYEEEAVTYEISGYQEEVEHDGHSSSSSHSEHGSDSEEPPILSPPHHTIDIPSVRRPPVPVMVPADRVSTHACHSPRFSRWQKESYFTMVPEEWGLILV